MAKAKASNGEVNKSAEVRAYYRRNRKAKPKQVCSDLLAEKGIRVTPNFVSQIRFKMKHKMAERRKGAIKAKAAVGARRQRRVPATAVTVDDVRIVKQLAESLGGVEKARQALDVLEELQ
jgi:hypothetical protein